MFANDVSDINVFHTYRAQGYDLESQDSLSARAERIVISSRSSDEGLRKPGCPHTDGRLPSYRWVQTLKQTVERDGKSCQLQALGIVSSLLSGDESPTKKKCHWDKTDSIHQKFQRSDIVSEVSYREHHREEYTSGQISKKTWVVDIELDSPCPCQSA